jgi:hypothetical protein
MFSLDSASLEMAATLARIPSLSSPKLGAITESSDNLATFLIDLNSSPSTIDNSKFQPSSSPSTSSSSAESISTHQILESEDNLNHANQLAPSANDPNETVVEVESSSLISPQITTSSSFSDADLTAVVAPESSSVSLDETSSLATHEAVSVADATQFVAAASDEVVLAPPTATVVDVFAVPTDNLASSTDTSSRPTSARAKKSSTAASASSSEAVTKASSKSSSSKEKGKSSSTGAVKSPRTKKSAS